MPAYLLWLSPTSSLTSNHGNLSYSEQPQNDDNPLYDDWCNAVLTINDDDTLARVLSNDPVLAYRWLVKYASMEWTESFRFRRAVDAAVSSIDSENRRKLLQVIPSDGTPYNLVRRLVGGDLGLYTELLKQSNLHNYHLAPLTREDTEIFAEKARLAIEAGYDTNVIVGSVLDMPETTAWRDSEAGYWRSWVNWFQELSVHPEVSIQEIGKAELSQAKDRFLQAELNERR